MRNIISVFLLIASLTSASAQRVFFEDPDLTFSFKKPKNWTVIDDGFVVKVFPAPKESISTFFSITYFEDAKPAQELSFLNTDEIEHRSYHKKIAGEVATVNTLDEDGSLQKSFQFFKYSQRFEVTIKQDAPDENSTVWSQLNRMIRTIRVTK